MKKYEEQIINYLIGGILGLVFLIPFMCPYIDFVWHDITTNELSYLTIGSLCMLSVFLLFTIAITAVVSKQDKREVLPTLMLYLKMVPFISLFLSINILNGFSVPLLYAVIISIAISIISKVLVDRKVKL